MKISNITLIFIFIILFFSIFQSIGYSQTINIESFSIDIPKNDCNYTWSISVTNPTKNVIKQINIKGKQGDGTNWYKTPEEYIKAIGPNETKSRTLKFKRNAGTTDFKAEVWSKGRVLAEETKKLPEEGEVNLKITNAVFNKNGYELTLVNNGTDPLADVKVQCDMTDSKNPRAWLPCGEYTIECMQSNNTLVKEYSNDEGWNNGYDFYRIFIGYAGNLISKKLFGNIPENYKKSVVTEPVSTESGEMKDIKKSLEVDESTSNDKNNEEEKSE